MAAASQAAVEVQDLARDVGRLVGGEEGDGRRDYVGQAEAAQRRCGLDRVPGRIGQPVGQLGDDEPGSRPARCYTNSKDVTLIALVAARVVRLRRS